MKGKIVKGIGGFYYVRAENGRVYACKARGVFRSRNIKPLVGDDVEIAVLGEDPPEGSIDEIFKRRSCMVRPAVANVDQALVVFAMRDPEPNLNLLDRFLVTMERMKIETVLVFNKADLADEAAVQNYRDIYEPAGYRVVALSTRTGEGLAEIAACLCGKTTVLAGPSGVGKSSLTNILLPEARMETGAVSEKIRRGKHTTRHSELFCVGDGAYLMDTPGFSALYVDDIEPEEFRDYFPEFKPFEKDCRFAGCVHIGEKICGVKSAVEAGAVSRSRYEDYRLFYTEQKEKRRYG